MYVNIHNHIQNRSICVSFHNKIAKRKSTIPVHEPYGWFWETSYMSTTCLAQTYHFLEQQ